MSPKLSPQAGSRFGRKLWGVSETARHLTSITVVQLARLGDLAQSWPLVACFRLSRPEQTIHLVVPAGLAPLAALMVGSENTIGIDLDRLRRIAAGGTAEGLRAMSQLSGILHRASADEVINLNYHPAVAAIAEAIPAPTHRGARWTDVIRGTPSDPQMEELFVSSGRSGGRHLCDVWASYADGAPMARTPPLPISSDVAHRAAGLQSRFELDDGVQPVGVVVGAGLAERAYPADSWARVVRRLDEFAPVILLGSAEESSLAQSIISAAEPCGHPVLNLCGATDPALLAGVLARCRLVVGVDTGPLHLAAAVGARCLGLYCGSMFFPQTGPYGDGNYVIAPDSPLYPCSEGEMIRHPAAFPAVPADLAADTAASLVRNEAPPTRAGWQLVQSQLSRNGLTCRKVSSDSNPPTKREALHRAV